MECHLRPEEFGARYPNQVKRRLVKALDDQATDKRLLDIGCVVPHKADRTPQALQKRVESEIALWSSVLKTVAAK